MAHSKNVEYEESLVYTTLPIFMELYNQSIPDSFPQASTIILNKFKASHPNLFKDGGDLWSTSKHRKQLMDWLPSNMINS
ncbi:MAG: hypothetical protein O2794_01335 [bacterium]|nr:hypothetical protein [bacterium]